MYRTALLAGTLVLAALALAACGGDDPSPTGTAATTERTNAADRATAPPSAPGAGAGRPSCAAQTRELLARMEVLRERLVTGLDYRHYVGQMKRVRGAYDALPVKRLGIRCLNDVGGPAESALNDYIDALNVWAGCVEVPGCQSTSIEAQLQSEWGRAARALDEARRAASSRNRL